jgi:hypothetical protein
MMNYHVIAEAAEYRRVGSQSILARGEPKTVRVLDPYFYK